MSKDRIRRLLFPAVLCLLLFVAGGDDALSSSPAGGGLATLRRGPITVLHAAGDEALAGEVASRAAFLHRRISEDLGLVKKVDATVLLVTPRLPEGNYRDLERRLEPWLAGAAFSERQFIVLRIRPGRLAREHDSTLAHELTHVILKGDYPGIGSWPLWFQEGLAMSESKGEGLRHHASLSVAALRGRLLSLEEIWIRFPDDQAGSRLAYAESFSIISFLVNRYGHRRFQEFMETLRVSDFEDAFRRTYATSLGAMEKEWRRHVQRHYTWIPLLTGGTAFWTLTLILFFLSLAARRRRNRLLREQWEEEDRREGW